MPDLSPEQQKEAEDLMARLASDAIQKRLRPGFERDFSDSVLAQWNERGWVSFEGQGGKRSQMDLVREIVERADAREAESPGRQRSSRRYEGHSGRRW